MRLPTLLALLLAAPVLATTAVATAQPGPPPPPGNYSAPAEHAHEGVYFRVHLGPGYTSFTDENDIITVSGAGGAFGLALGWAVTPNIIVYGEVFDDLAIDPTLTYMGSTATSNNISAGAIGLGAGVAYYFMPVNAYVSATLAMAQLSIQDTDTNEQLGETDFGPGVSLMAGKEWWVTQNWGLGVAGQVFIGSEPEKNADFSYRTTAFAVVLTASYN